MNNNNNNGDKVVITVVLVICGILVLGVAAFLFFIGVIFFTAVDEFKTFSDEYSERYEEYEDSYYDEDDEYYEEDYEEEEDYDTSIEDEAYSTESFIRILPSEIASLSKGKTIVVWVGRQSCSYCAMYAPVISDVGKDNNIPVYYVDLEDLINFDSQYPYISDERNYNILEGLDGIEGWETFAKDNMGGTPLTLIIKDNKVIGGLSGYTEEDGVINEFKRTGLIEN